MKILHGPVNIGGMASSLARAQRRLGHGAKSIVFADNYLKYPADIDLSKHASWRWITQQHFLLRLCLEYKVFQYYYGATSFGDDLWEIPWLRRLGKKVYFYFCGCDLRDADATIAKYEPSMCAHCQPRACRPNRIRARSMALEHGNVNFVSTPDLVEFLPGAVLLPQAVDFDLIETIDRTPRTRSNDNRFLVAHAPTNRALKGTSYLVRAVEELKNEGWPIDLLLIENMSHEDALRAYRRADLGVDQLLSGAYGLLSAELMALGIPTMCYLRPDLIPLYPEVPPLINANLANLKEQLKHCCESRDYLQSVTKESRAYARKVHHPMTIAKTCLNYYMN